MKNILLLAILLLSQFCLSQDKEMKTIIAKAKQQKPPEVPESGRLKTVVLTIDLSSPNKDSNVKISNDRKRLTFENNQLLQVQLINGNPYKYTYVINYATINLFSETNTDFLQPIKANITEEPDNQVNTVTEKDDDEILRDQEELLDSIKAFDKNLQEYHELLIGMENLDYKLHNQFRSASRNLYLSIVSKLEKLEEIIKNSTPKDPKIANKLIFIKSNLEAATPLYLKIMKALSNSYLLPIDAFGDNIDYVEIKLERYQGTTKIDEYIYKLWLTGGVKIDFSAGAFITSLVSRSYSSTAKTTSNSDGTVETNYLITEDNIGNYNLGFGPMANIAFRTGGYFKPTLNVGTLLTSDLDFQILAGAGLIIGKSERFIFHTGIAMGSVDEIKNTLKADGTTGYSLNDPSTIPTVETFKFGYFFGVSYNFNSAKKE